MKSIRWMGRAGLLALPMLMLIGAPVAHAAATPQEKAAQEAKDTARQSGSAVKDSWVTMKVHSLFVPEDALENSDIDVDTKAGAVTLTGTVATEAGRARAVAIAKSTDGVTRVNDRLRVAAVGGAAASAREAGQAAKETAGTTGRAVSDGWLKSKIYSQFITEDSLEQADIDIDISKGVVTLTGAVPTKAAGDRAEAIAKATDGVKSVTSKLEVAK